VWSVAVPGQPISSGPFCRLSLFLATRPGSTLMALVLFSCAWHEFYTHRLYLAYQLWILSDICLGAYSFPNMLASASVYQPNIPVHHIDLQPILSLSLLPLHSDALLGSCLFLPMACSLSSLTTDWAYSTWMECSVWLAQAWGPCSWVSLGWRANHSLVSSFFFP
jgi:hypothetical protein